MRLSFDFLVFLCAPSPSHSPSVSSIHVVEPKTGKHYMPIQSVCVYGTRVVDSASMNKTLRLLKKAKRLRTWWPKADNTHAACDKWFFQSRGLMTLIFIHKEGRRFPWMWLANGGRVRSVTRRVRMPTSIRKHVRRTGFSFFGGDNTHFLAMASFIG